MSDMTTVTAFFGWCTVINAALLIFSVIWLATFRDFTKSLHSTLLGVDEDKLDIIYFQYLGNYKIAIIVLNLVPYIALRIMS